MAPGEDASSELRKRVSVLNDAQFLENAQTEEVFPGEVHHLRASFAIKLPLAASVRVDRDTQSSV